MSNKEPWYTQYKSLVEYNQRLKNASSYYLLGETWIYLKSTIPYLHRAAYRKPEVDLSVYTPLIVDPVKLFSFTRDAKKSKLWVHQEKEMILLGQEESDLSLSLSTYNDELLPELLDLCYGTGEGSLDPSLWDAIRCLPYEDMGEEGVERVSEGLAFDAYPYEQPDLMITVTKEILPCLKKTDRFSLALLPSSILAEPDREVPRRYVALREETPLMDVYHVGAILDPTTKDG